MDSIVYYSDNPNLGIKTVTTVSGQKEYRKNCKKIKDNYYVINKECFLIDDTWFRIDSGLIALDHENKDWFLLKKMPSDMINGIVDMRTGEKGYFRRNPYKNVQTFRKEIVLSEDVANEGGYGEYFSTGLFYKKADLGGQRITNELNHTNKGYNIEDNKEEYPRKVKFYEEYPTVINEQVKKFARLLGSTTFGIELECQKGYLADHLQNRLGVVICRDGSLKDENGNPGPEFVTIPMMGEKGVQSIIDLCNALKKRTEIGINCSLHIHLGNIDTSRTFLVSLFRLCNKIQNEIFQMFPYYKANPQGIKHKNYNQKLPTLQLYTYSDDKKSINKYIDQGYRKIFMWLADGALEPDFSSGKKVYKHPRQHKWERGARYYWMNSMNVIFSERNTIEFRLHTPTTNAQKVFNWLFICNAIIRYAEAHAEEIITSRKAIKLQNILNYYSENFGEDGAFMSEYLRSYISSRKDRFLTDYEKGDKISMWDIEEDKGYEFRYQEIENIFK